MVNGYTMVLDNGLMDLGIRVIVNKKTAEEIAKNAWEWHALPKNSKQVPILIFAKADIVGVPSRIRSFLG